MTDEPVVNLYPDHPRRPTAWTSADGGAPTVTLRKEADHWVARFDRQPVAVAATPEQLTAHLLGEFGLLAVLNENAASVAA
jgi:hypothetical protein